MEEDDRRPVVAAFLEKVVCLLKIRTEKAIHAVVGREPCPAGENRFAHLVIFGIAYCGAEKILLVERMPQRLQDLRVVKRFMQMVGAEGELVAESVPVDDLHVRSGVE